MKPGWMTDPFTDSPNGPVFTDEDLDDFKALLSNPYEDHFANEKVRSLVARLEAAEAVIATNYGEYGEGTEKESYAPSGELYITWRKAAGK